jgi:hypothetical protein
MNYVSSAVNVLNPFASAKSNVKAVETQPGENKSAEDVPTRASRSDSESEPAEFSEEQLRNKEGALAYLLRAARNKFIDRGLEGKIIINMLYGVVTSGEYCTVTQQDKADELDESDARNLGTLNFKVLSAMDMVLANLSRRSKARESADLIYDTTLTQGLTIGLSLPFFISFGFQTTIQFEVSVKSMVAYRKRKEKLRLVEKKLKAIPNAWEIIRELEIGGGFRRDVAQNAVLATNGSSTEDALRWVVEHDKNMEEFAREHADQMAMQQQMQSASVSVQEMNTIPEGADASPADAIISEARGANYKSPRK